MHKKYSRLVQVKARKRLGSDCRCQNRQISGRGSQAVCLRIDGNMDMGFYPASGSLEEIIPYMLLIIFNVYDYRVDLPRDHMLWSKT